MKLMLVPTRALASCEQHVGLRQEGLPQKGSTKLMDDGTTRGIRMLLDDVPDISEKADSYRNCMASHVNHSTAKCSRSNGLREDIQLQT